MKRRAEAEVARLAAAEARAALGVAAGREKEAKGRFTLLHEAQTKAQRARETATVKKGGKGVGGVVSKLMGGSKKKKDGGGGGGGGPTDAEVAEGAALASTEAEKEAAAEAAKEANLAYAKLKDAILEEEYELQRLRAAELAEAQEAQADDDGGGSDGGGGGSGDDGGSGDESDDSDFLHDGAPPAARAWCSRASCARRSYTATSRCRRRTLLSSGIAGGSRCTTTARCGTLMSATTPTPTAPGSRARSGASTSQTSRASSSRTRDRSSYSRSLTAATSSPPTARRPPPSRNGGRRSRARARRSSRLPPRASIRQGVERSRFPTY